MKVTLLLASLFILVLGGGYLLKGRVPVQPDTVPVISNSLTPSSDGTYTQAEIASHAVSQDCWVSINEGVYNLTSWINQHPGGESAIVTICGKDGTNAFEGQHENDGRANALLATFKIGTLAQ